MKVDVNDDFMTDLAACFKEEKRLYRKMDKLRAKLDENEKRKAALARILHQQFVKNNKEKFSEHTPYYYAFLNVTGSVEIVVIKLKYDSKYIPGYSDRYAVFNPVGNPNFNVNVELNILPEDYEEAKVVIDQAQLDLLKRFFTIKYED
jgi:hypothetical protein